MPTTSLAAAEQPYPTVIITLVHGTWGRGVFPALRISKKPFWFERGGAFREKLLTDLRSREVSYSLRVLIWSGANSILHREGAAKRLAKKLAINAKQNPTAHQVIIAHSHGGNIAAGALGHLHIDLSNISVCYLATPFIQIFPRKLGFFEAIRLAISMGLIHIGLLTILFSVIIFLFIWLNYPDKLNLDFLASILTREISPLQYSISFVLVSSVLFLGAIGGYRFLLQLISEKNLARNERLIQATANIRDEQTHGGAFILRAIEDEASLALSAGTIANLFSAQIVVISTFLLLLWPPVSKITLQLGYNEPDYALYEFLFLAFNFILVLMAWFTTVASRSVYGKELFNNPHGTQMNFQSVPDFIQSARIQTLLRDKRGLFSSLRHGLYSYPGASIIIADWISAEAHRAYSRAASGHRP